MWIYEKKLEYPISIKKPDPKLAQLIISQLGGPDGELGASMRYLNQRYSMPPSTLKYSSTAAGVTTIELEGRVEPSIEIASEIDSTVPPVGMEIFAPKSIR